LQMRISQGSVVTIVRARWTKL